MSAWVLWFSVVGWAGDVPGRSGLDTNGDGRPDQWTYAHPGRAFIYRMDVDYNLDGKSDVIVDVNEDDGSPTAVRVDRDTWPVNPAVGTEAWLAERQQAVAAWWAITGRAAALSDDHCNEQLSRGEGYLLTTRDLLSSDAYMQGMKARLMGMMGSSVDTELAFWATFFGHMAATDWLVSPSCIGNWSVQPGGTPGSSGDSKAAR